MFNQLKHAWGLQETWQQTRHACLRSLGANYRAGLCLAAADEAVADRALDQVRPMDTPWRAVQPITHSRQDPLGIASDFMAS